MFADQVHKASGFENGPVRHSSSAMQNARLYLAETTRLFTQLWASLQSGEADGGAFRQKRLDISLLNIISGRKEAAI